jgi:phosphoribosylaminoimidazole-succinocarboxamide synthase
LTLFLEHCQNDDARPAPVPVHGSSGGSNSDRCHDAAPRRAPMSEPAVFDSDLTGLTRTYRGKVRDVYALPDGLMLIVATDRLSAFDVVLPDPIPDKGRTLNTLSNFWFARLAHVIGNHLTGIGVERYVTDAQQQRMLRDRAVVVKRLRALPIEAVVRGYLIGSGWKDYSATGRICGIELPPGLRLADRLPVALFTPASKAPAGAHDENVTFAQVETLIGPQLAGQVRDSALALYREAAEFALTRGIIIADTKFEFGVDDAGRLILIDEALTPDSSRFWPVASYRPGENPPSFDKQYVRDYLETLNWDKRPPAPRLPEAVIRATSERYREALKRLAG